VKKFIIYSILCLSITACNYTQNNPKITSREVKEFITFLASDSLKGRFTGTKEAESAANFIMRDFKKSGLKPLFKKSYFQEFPFISSISYSGKNYCEIDLNKAKLTPILNTGYAAAPFSGNAEVNGNLVFAGYGISAPDLKYDDYKDIDVKGKIVIIMRYHPDLDSPHSNFEKYSPYRYKARIAKEKGAAGVIFVNGFSPKDDEDKLMPLTYDGAAGMENFPVVQVKRNYINSILIEEGIDFTTYQKNIDSTKTPASFELKFSKVKISTSLDFNKAKGINVAGWIEGSDPKLKNEFIVIGAHYDHLGFGETGSLYRGKEKLIHHGADDNASGTAGVMELAEQFATNKKLLKRSVIFICFAGEELGLLGSEYFVKNSPIETEKMISMLNLDMVGRLNDENSLIVYGTGTSSVWKKLLNEENKKYNFKLSFNDEGYGPSDQTSFYGKQIPVLFFFTGTHTDYHRPSDVATKINFTGEVKILDFVSDLALSIIGNKNKPDYINVPVKDSGRARTFKVYLGTIPDFSYQGSGYKINGVNDGSPAQKGGIKAGDVMVSFGGKNIANIYDYTYALGEFKPGDIVDVIVKRDGKEIKLKVELGAK